jgi:hypothetical protein
VLQRTFVSSTQLEPLHSFLVFSDPRQLRHDILVPHHPFHSLLSLTQGPTSLPNQAYTPLFSGQSCAGHTTTVADTGKFSRMMSPWFRRSCGRTWVLHNAACITAGFNQGLCRTREGGACTTHCCRCMYSVISSLWGHLPGG